MMNDNWQLIQNRNPNSNKYDYGHVLIIGGSKEMAGAPILAARAAMRTGAGLVTIASTAEATALFDRDIEEVMTLTLPSWSHVQEMRDNIEKFIVERHVSVVVVGPGLPREADMAIRTLLPMINKSLVLDAECFTALSGHLEILKQAAMNNRNIVLTPHTGEFARLLGHDIQNEQEEAINFATVYSVALVVKRHCTLVVGAEGGVYQNATGNPSLATAGTGDILAGIIAGMLAQSIPPFEAAKMAVYLHGYIADEKTKAGIATGMIASDILEGIPRALLKLAK